MLAVQGPARQRNLEVTRWVVQAISRPAVESADRTNQAIHRAWKSFEVQRLTMVEGMKEAGRAPRTECTLDRGRTVSMSRAIWTSVC